MQPRTTASRFPGRYPSECALIWSLGRDFGSAMPPVEQPLLDSTVLDFGMGNLDLDLHDYAILIWYIGRVLGLIFVMSWDDME